MSSLICPHCGTATSFDPITLAALHRRSDSPYTRDHLRNYWDSFYAVAMVESGKKGIPDYAFAVCAACSMTYVATRRQGEDWLASFPIPAINVSEEIPPEIRSAFKEAKLSYAINAYQACIIMCRTALIRLQREQGVRKDGLKSLFEQGKISRSMFERANELRHWANMAGHEDIPPDTISQTDCEELLVYTESLLNELYVAPAKLRQLTDKRKSISKEQKQA